MEIVILPCLQSNYGYLVHNSEQGLTAAVDTPSAEVVLDALEERGWKLDYILNTHHHWDHTNGNLELKQRTGCTVYSPTADIPGVDHVLTDGSQFALGTEVATVMTTPGHTMDHIVYVFADTLFAGDTLFSMGCGRLFEGSPDIMWQSLSRLVQLPESTMMYCAHEYSEDNGRFAMSVEPNNADLKNRVAEVKALRAAGKPSLPVTMGEEKKTNPFLRAGSEEIRVNLGMTDASDVEVFTELRRRKDNFS